MRYVLATIGIIVLACLVAFSANTKEPKLDIETKAKILNLQRDVVLMEMQISPLRQKLQEKTAELDDEMKKLQFPGWNLNPTTLEYMPVKEGETK